jgi:tetratricopeptide (TPR) repeat protein
MLPKRPRIIRQSWQTAAIFLTLCVLASAQSPDPAYTPLAKAYDCLRAHDYDAAISAFRQAVDLAPARSSIRKDLAYTYLKTGENELAREQFRVAMEIDPADIEVALEYAFLTNESKQQPEARRIFDRIRRTGNAVAEQAFQNIDGPLAAGIERWKKALTLGPDNFSAHFELATLAEQRGELESAAEHYERAWRILPDRRSVLVDLGRVWVALNCPEDAGAALLAASRGGEPRAAEMARALLPERYPYVPEFRSALQFDPDNFELRRELGYLLLRMDQPAEAEGEFRYLADHAPGDLLAATQLGFLLYARGERQAAMPLFDRVLAATDDDLANRVRAVLGMPQVMKPRADARPTSIDAKVMAERSIKAGYMKDALQYLQVAHEADPADFDVMLKLGWTYNIIHQDRDAVRWFELARKSPDPETAALAGMAWRNLHAGLKRWRTSAWLYPIFSTRWHDLFSYAQAKTELRTGWFLEPYASVRFAGDSRLNAGTIIAPQYLSESAFIVAAGLRTLPWHRVMGWFEAGSSMSYVTGHLLPDYRGGISIARAGGHVLNGESGGWFADTALAAVFVSRFGNDFLVYNQSRAGFTAGPADFRVQLYWAGNATFDDQRQYWANLLETGPGIRLRAAWMPPSMYFTGGLFRGAYLINAGNPRRPNFNDFRAGFWYAFTR